MYIRGNAGERLSFGQEGESVVSGRHVARGYWRADNETKQPFFSRSLAWAPELQTGDLRRVDDDGFIYIVRRKDAILKHRGCRFSSTEVECETTMIKGVREACWVKILADDKLQHFSRC